MSDALLDALFNQGRSQNGWLDKSVDPALLEQAYDLAKMAPTSANCSPLRIIFVASAAGKERLKPCLMEGNVAKTMAAPVTAILAQDMEFYRHLPTLFPHTDAASWFAGNEPLIAETAFRNSTLQAAYFILALRAVGLDSGAMSGFDKAAVDAEFLSDSSWRSNFLLNIGYGDPAALFASSPRFGLADVARWA